MRNKVVYPVISNSCSHNMTQQSNIRFYTFSLLLGLLGFIYFDLRDHSLYWYSEFYFERFRNDFEPNYLKFYWILSSVALSIGLLTKINSTNNSIWLIGALMFIFFNILTLGTGLIFTFHDARGEYDIYFTESQSVWIYYLVGVGLFLKSLWTNSKLNIKSITFIVASGIFGGGIIYTALSFVGFIELSHLWLISTLICISIYLGSKVQNQSKNMKKLKTFTITLGILWAFSNSIYSYIKTKEVHELKNQNQELGKEAIELIDQAEQEAAYAKEAEAAVLRAKKDLELCENGQ